MEINVKQEFFLDHIRQNNKRLYSYVRAPNSRSFGIMNRISTKDVSDDILDFLNRWDILVYSRNSQIAYYDIEDDLIIMPLKRSFIKSLNYSAEQTYYATLFHEVFHWSGNVIRLCRKGLYMSEDALEEELLDKHDAYLYYVEEIAAEIFSYLMLLYFDISEQLSTNSVTLMKRHLELIPDKLQDKYFKKSFNQAINAFKVLTRRKRSIHD